MNIWQLGEDFRALFAAEAAFAAVRTCNSQDAGEWTDEPHLIFAPSVVPFSADGTVGRFTLLIHVLSHAGDTTGAEHSALVAAVLDQLHDATKKAALIAGLADTERWTVYGYSAGEDGEQLEANRFATPVRISGTVRAL